jgi:hypothetical protein
MSVIFPSYLFLFVWSSRISVLRGSCWEEYRHLRTLETKELFQTFFANLLEMDVSIHKLESITKDGAPAITSGNVSLIGLGKKYCGVFAPFKNS